MAYRVILSAIAEKELEDDFRYILFELSNPMAAEAFLEDAQKTINILSKMADVFKLCEDPDLMLLGCCVIHFKKYRYKMIYRISGDAVEIDGIYHNLQDLRTNYGKDHPQKNRPLY